MSENNNDWIPDDTDSLLTEIVEQSQLTKREKEILGCIWNGASNQEISDKLKISVNTVKFHVGSLYTKLEVKNRSEARMLKEEVEVSGEAPAILSPEAQEH